MSDIILHQLTAAQVSSVTGRPPHALLLVGPAGCGKQYLSEYIAQQLLGLDTVHAVRSYVYFKPIEPEKDKSTIGIEAVRELQQFVKLKLPADRPWRIITICDAGNLSGEAQNAILKLLEEPPERTIFMLTATTPQAVLPTIRSRVQQLTIHQPPQADVISYFEAQGYDSQQVQQTYPISGGLPGLMHALLEQEEHPLKSAVQTARKLLQSTQFERLCLVDELAKKKPETLQLLFVLQHMARAATVQSAKVSDGSAAKRIKQWHKIQSAAYEAEKAYTVSAQAKLTLTNLMLSL
jgi:replication-associated recombination protein RarA